MSFFNKLRQNEEGATAIEYGLIAALIAIAGITAFGALGNSIESTMFKASSEMDSAIS
jgi:pilus assembly protein Flp/PilA